MDMLKELSAKINFTYNLELSPDGQFGSYMVKNSSSKYVAKHFVDFYIGLYMHTQHSKLSLHKLNNEQLSFLNLH